MTNHSRESAARSPTAFKRMTINLTDDVAQMLEKLAASQGITQNEAIRRAIATESYLKGQLESGSTLLIQKSNKDIREVVFR
jgi:metal-responsive CopG/Arc/MetJ family transcriptional regulator